MRISWVGQPPEGARHLGNYRLIRPLGQGGFADVYLGEHIYLQTQVAIKVLQMRLAKEEMEGFLGEARTIAHLVHLHIVRVLDFGIEDGTPFLVMDYAQNGTLRQRYPKGTTLPLSTIVSSVKQVASALQYAHENKVIHRDIKPENMLLGANHQVLLSDFGIALMAQSTRYQPTQEVLGTAAYMAPEQLQGKPRPPSDQYALGIVTYEWITGDRPFHGSFPEIYSQHLFLPPSPLREKRPDLPPAIEEVVQTALKKDPKERFASIHAFATALEQACQRSIPHTVILPPLSQPFPATDTVAAVPSHLEGGLTDTVTPSSIPPKARSATPFAEPFSTPSLPHETPPASLPRTRTYSARASHLENLSKSKLVLLLSLAFLVIVGSLGLLGGTKIYQMTVGTMSETATAQTNATKVANVVATSVQANAATATTQALVAASVTATIASNLYTQATSGTPVLNDPLTDNSKGNGWPEGNTCVFTGGAYHVRIEMKGYYEVCFPAPTFSNFAFQVHMTILKGDYGGMVFRTNKANPFGYRLALVRTYADFNYGNTLLAKSTSFKANLNQAYVLTVIARGSSLSLYIDKHWMATVEDSSASSGGIGLMAGNFSGDSDVAFTNAEVWNL